MVVTHGNGPQVGFILRRNELAAPEVHSTPLDVIGADTQGSIGYMISRALDNEFKQRGVNRDVAAVVTQVVVDREDPGFKNPTKGIGGFTTKDNAEKFEQEGWMVKEDAGRGWRRMIASPIPLRIVERPAIKSLIDSGFVVVGVGGGGIPVIEDEQGMLHGVFAVIDKDRRELAPGRRPEGRPVPDLDRGREGRHQLQQARAEVAGQADLSEAKKYYAEGHFLSGSMGPKIEAMIAFLEANPNGKGLITDPPHIVDALERRTGTWIVQDEDDGPRKITQVPSADANISPTRWYVCPHHGDDGILTCSLATT